MYIRASHLLTLAAGLLLTGGPALAQGLIIPRPVRPVPAWQPLSVRSQRVSMRVVDGAARVEVEQLYYNPNGVPMEGTYLFPLPESASVSNFRMQVDREPTEGKLLTSDEARRLYESFVRRNVDPALLEYVGRNAFQARIFPIPAGGERKITLVYSQAPEQSGGIYRLVYPLNSERVTGGTLGDLTIDCNIQSSQPIRSVYSPTHEVAIKRDGEKNARATFEGKEVRPNRDFVLYYTTSEREFGLNALEYRRPGEDGYVMLMLAPKARVAAAEIQPRDVVFVFDTSGSMQGVKIDQARQALRTMLGALNDRDRFNIIRFSSDVTSFRASVVPANAQNRDAARAFVDQLKAIGGTAIDDALQQALASFPPQTQRDGHAPYLIFMTDGLPTIGNTDVEQILKGAAKAAPSDLRMFPFGVGADVNTLLLDRLARDNRGVAEYVVRDEDLESKIGGFYAKISNPVLANVKLSVSGVQLLDPYPAHLPDLFAGTQLLVLGRYKGQGKATVTLTGELDGKPQRFTYDLNVPERELSNDFISKLWASRRIGFLLEEIRLHGENAELKDEVVRLSKEHGIVTPYTSYLVEEAGVPGQLPAALNFPAGRAGSVPAGPGGPPGSFGGGSGFGGFGRTATPPATNPFSQNSTGAGGESATPSYFRFEPGAKKEAASRNLQRGAALPAKPGASANRDRRSKSDAAGNSLGLSKQPAPGNGLQDAARQAQNGQAYGYQSQAPYLQQAEGFRHSTGVNAVEASRRVQQLKDKAQADTDVDLSHSVDGRPFRWVNGIWTDQTITGKPHVVTIKYASDAYFALVSAHPSWARILAQGHAVLFRTGKSAVVKVDATGKEKLTPAELKSLER